MSNIDLYMSYYIPLSLDKQTMMLGQHPPAMRAGGIGGAPFRNPYYSYLYISKQLILKWLPLRQIKIHAIDT